MTATELASLADACAARMMRDNLLGTMCELTKFSPDTLASALANAFMEGALAHKKDAEARRG